MVHRTVEFVQQPLARQEVSLVDGVAGTAQWVEVGAECKISHGKISSYNYVSDRYRRTIIPSRNARTRLSSALNLDARTSLTSIYSQPVSSNLSNPTGYNTRAVKYLVQLCLQHPLLLIPYFLTTPFRITPKSCCGKIRLALLLPLPRNC